MRIPFVIRLLFTAVTFKRACAIIPSLNKELQQVLSEKNSAKAVGFKIMERIKDITQKGVIGLSELDGPSSENNTSGPTLFIFGGTETDIISHPYQGAMQFDVNNTKGSNSNPGDWRFICGCALISRRWCLTAAHCVDRFYDSFNYRVRLGVDDINIPETTGQIMRVVTAVYHPKWPRTCERNEICYPNDIAAVKFSRDAVFNRAVQPVRMSANRKSLRNYECLQTGFGQTEAGRPLDGKLRKGIIPPIPNEVCSCNWLIRSPKAIFDGHICLFRKDEKVSNCFVSTDEQGDSGGPYVCRRGPKAPWILVGITSYGYYEESQPSCVPILPNVNSRVSFHCRWIRNVTGLPKYCKY